MSFYGAMVQLKERATELITNHILLTWDWEGEEPHPSLLSGLNVFLDFLTEFDRFLARAAGLDCRVNLWLDSLEERGFRFILRYELIPSDQLYLGQREVTHDLKHWLVQLHSELLTALNGSLPEDGLESLIERARAGAERLDLGRELYFSLLSSARRKTRLEKKYRNFISAQQELNGGLSLKIE